MKRIILTSLMTLLASQSLAWTYQANATITSIIKWENADTKALHFKRSDSTWCYVPVGDTEMRDLIMVLYTTERIADIHCYDEAENVTGGVAAAHKVHRIIAK